MKILYAIQGTGNGHLSRARDIIPELEKRGKLDILISGRQNDLKLPFPVKYHCHGLSFVFGKSGGVDLLKTFLHNHSRRFLKEVKNLPVEKYDLLINDFEPVTAWAAYRRNIPCIALSHQCALLSENSPKPEHTDVVGSFILKNYAPFTSAYGFHFSSLAENVYTPVIRKEVRTSKVSNKGHYTVYLPSFDKDYLVKKLGEFRNTKWEIFSKYCKNTYTIDHVTVKPVKNQDFISSMATSEGVLCGAGFETPAEALFLRKKLLVIPMKNQYEQHCNAAALQKLGVPVIKNLKQKNFYAINEWLDTRKIIDVEYNDNNETIIKRIIDNHGRTSI